jgi:spore coat protein B
MAHMIKCNENISGGNKFMNKDLITSLMNKVVRIDRGGPESRIGKLLAVEDDHITLLTENDGVVYYVTHHIKSITDNAKQGLEFNIGVPENFEFLRANNYKNLLRKLKFRWVKINRGGPETLEGILNDANDDFVTIVSCEEIIRLSMFHIRNISYGVKIEKSESSESGSNKNSDNSNKSSNSNKNSDNSNKSSNSKESSDNSNRSSNSNKNGDNSNKSSNSKENSDNSKEEKDSK